MNCVTTFSTVTYLYKLHIFSVINYYKLSCCYNQLHILEDDVDYWLADGNYGRNLIDVVMDQRED